MMKAKTFYWVLPAMLLPITSVSAQDWGYHVAPYLWATSLDGSQTIRGRDLEVDATFSDLVEFVDIGGALHFEAQNPQWGWFGDIFYSKLSDEETLPNTVVRGEVKQTIIEGGVTYRLGNQLEALGGLRYQQSKLDFNVLGVGGINDDESWTDAFGGLRWTPINSDRWITWLRGDIGAGDSDFVWLASIGAGYKFNENYTLLGAYRYLDTDYESGDFGWDIAQSGLGIALDISW